MMSISPRRILVTLIVGPLLAAAGWVLGSDGRASNSATTDRVVLTDAEFSPGDTGHWTPVTLPDTWRLRGLPNTGEGRYRTSFTLPHAPLGTWAVRMDRVSAAHALSLNGRSLRDYHLSMAALRYTQPKPVLIAIPEGFLRAGENTLELRETVGSRGGLSRIEFGPLQELEPEFAWYSNLTQGLPQALNLSGAGLAFFMLLLWWQRRSEVAIGSFAVLWILASIRNINYYPSGAALPQDLSNWFFFSTHAWTGSLLGVLALSLAGVQWHWFRRILAFVAVAWPGVGAVMISLGEPMLLRKWAYPGLYLMFLPTMWLLVKAARQLHGRRFIGIIAAFLVLAGTMTHDNLAQFGLVSTMHSLWQPFALPLTMAGFAWLMVQRMVRALTREERRAVFLEHRVTERTAALAQANASKTRFLAAASHDLRQPVVTIGLLVGLLREQIGTPALRGLIDRVYDAVTALEMLLKGLLDLSRLDSGSVKPRMEPVALQPMLDSIATHERETARAKGLKLRLRATDVTVVSDPILLEQILRNLVNNALRYTDSGGVLVCARRRGTHSLLLQVWDTGRGIPHEQQAAVFEEFVQLGNAARDSRHGLGLGLAIVKRSAQLLSCRLQLRSQPGRGSCFSVELPYVVHSDAPELPEAASPRPLIRHRVVLVEDDAAVREALELRLVRWGANVRAFDSVASLKQGLLALPRSMDLIITDNRLPSGNAMQVVELLRQHAGTAVPALVVTGDTAPHDIAALLDTGLPVLHKPFRAEQLWVAIQAAQPARTIGT